MNKLELIFERIVSLEKEIQMKKKDFKMIDKDVYLITDYYLNLTKEERLLARSLISDKASEFFIGLTPNFSALAIDMGDIQWVKRAIILHIFDGFADYRMNTLYLDFVLRAVGRRYKSLGAEYMEISPFINDRDLFANERSYSFIQNIFNEKLSGSVSVGMYEKKLNDKTCFVDGNRKDIDKQCLKMIEMNSYFEKLSILYATN